MYHKDGLQLVNLLSGKNYTMWTSFIKNGAEFMEQIWDHAKKILIKIGNSFFYGEHH